MPETLILDIDSTLNQLTNLTPMSRDNATKIKGTTINWVNIKI